MEEFILFLNAFFLIAIFIHLILSVKAMMKKTSFDNIDSELELRDEMLKEYFPIAYKISKREYSKDRYLVTHQERKYWLRCNVLIKGYIEKNKCKIEEYRLSKHLTKTALIAVVLTIGSTISTALTYEIGYTEKNTPKDIILMPFVCAVLYGAFIFFGVYANNRNNKRKMGESEARRLPTIQDYYEPMKFGDSNRNKMFHIVYNNLPEIITEHAPEIAEYVIKLFNYCNERNVNCEMYNDILSALITAEAPKYNLYDTKYFDGDEFYLSPKVAIGDWKVKYASALQEYYLHGNFVHN